MERLTSNQAETLAALVQGGATGMIAKPIPSLIKRGLVIEDVVVNPFPWIPGGRAIRYRLTPLGLETYQKLRTKWHQARLKDLEGKYNSDMSRAKGMTVTAEKSSDQACKVFNHSDDDRCEHGMFFSGAGACPQCGGGAE